MHDNITTRIIEYLQLDTSYAIILNGNYGVGKTHYIKTELFPKIKELEEKDDSKKYTPVLVSLFGIKSIEDIKERIFFELHPIYDKKGVKIAASFGNAFIKYFGVDAKEIWNDAAISDGSLTPYSKILICIDDIDRKSTALDLGEVWGFVNDLVENANAKVLLITNEDKLRSELEAKEAKDDDYSLLKEKVIGVTMNFSSNAPLIFEEIIKSKYKKDEKLYFDFLTKHKDVINHRISQNEGNLRNLLFFLEHFKIIFKVSEETLSEDEKYSVIKDKVLEDALNLALPVSIEYKKGKLGGENLERIKNLYCDYKNWLTRLMIRHNKEELQPKGSPDDYVGEYQKNYLARAQNHINDIYYESIFEYITGKAAFDKNKFREELNLKYKFEGKKIPRREEILNKLSYWKFVDLSFEDYQNLTEEMLSYVDKGEYALDQYVNIFHLAIRYEILGYDLKDLEARFIKGINTGKESHKYITDYRFSNRKDDYDIDELNEINNYCKLVNEEMYEKEEKEELLCLFKDFQDNPMEFFDRIDNESPRRKLLTVLSEFDFDDFWLVIKTAKNKVLMKLGYYLANKPWNDLSTGNDSEKELLVKLKAKLLEEKDESTTDIMAKVTYEVLAKTIDELLEKKYE